MAKAKPDLSKFAIQKPGPKPVSAPAPAAKEEKPAPSEGRLAAKSARPLKTKAFELTPEAVREFEILRAETGKKSYELAAEALNLLFRKYDKPQVA